MRLKAHNRLAPLFDANGRLAFFIGGQINCSTTIRSNTDVLRILSMSDEPEEDVEGQKSVHSIKPTKRSFFGFKKKERKPQTPTSTKRVEVLDSGMEPGLLKQIEKMNFRTQMEAFYTAYSKVGVHLTGLSATDSAVVPGDQVLGFQHPILFTGHC